MNIKLFFSSQKRICCPHSNISVFTKVLLIINLLLEIILRCSCQGNKINAPPPPPTGLNVIATGYNWVSLQWTAKNEASSYKIFQLFSAPGNDYLQVGITTGTIFTDLGLIPGNIYYYAVKAVSDSGLESTYSDRVEAIPFRSGREICVTDQYGNTVRVFDATQIGGGEPLRIFRSTAVLNSPSGIAINKGTDELFVTNTYNNFSVLTFSRTSIGDVPPLRTISGLSTELDRPWGIAIDTMNNSIVVANSYPSLTAYPLTTTGDIPPGRIISGPTTGLGGSEIAIDTMSNEVLVANWTYNSITAYPLTATGDVAPGRMISGPSTGLFRPSSIAIDIINNEFIVGNDANDSLTVYPRNANGNIAPLRTISGPSTELDWPWGIAIDTDHDEIFVANSSGRKITVYPRTANGNVAPERSILDADYFIPDIFAGIVICK